MVESPDYEGPVGTVPQTTDRECQKDGIHPTHLSSPASPERDVDVVPKPSAETDVPSSPELPDTRGGVGHGEVSHEIETEEARQPDRDVRVATEIAVYLKREEPSGPDQWEPLVGAPDPRRPY